MVEETTAVDPKPPIDYESINRFKKVLDAFEVMWKSGWTSQSKVHERTWKLAIQAIGRKEISELTKELTLLMLERIEKMKREGYFK